MLYWLADFSGTLSVFNVFRYLTVRTGGAMLTAAMFVFLFGPWIIDHLRLRQGKGQPIREDGPQSHLTTKRGTPTMGGLMILSGVTVSTVLWANPSNPYVWIVLGVTLALRAGRLLRRLSEGHEAEPWRLRGTAAPASSKALVAFGACWALVSLGRPPFATSLDVSVLQGAGVQSRLVLPHLRRLHHRRRRQCREPDRRPRRACDRPGDDRGRLLRRVLLRGRQRVPDRLSAASFRAGHRRAGDPVRRGDRRGARLPLVQCAAGLDLHGRHRLARARRAARHRSRSRPSTRSRSRSSAGCSCSKPCR